MHQINPGQISVTQQKSVLFDKANKRHLAGHRSTVFDDGSYICANCGAKLFDATNKFDSAAAGRVLTEALPGSLPRTPTLTESHGMIRTTSTLRELRRASRTLSSTTARLIRPEALLCQLIVAGLYKMMSKTIYIAGGCFWGLEELFRARPGVIDTEAGYAGEQITTRRMSFTQVTPRRSRSHFDESTTTADELYDYFFRVHDPTTLDRQGNDIGTSYRSTIFYESDDDNVSGAKISRAASSGLWHDPIVTSLEPLNKFWPAEDHHQDYLQKHPGGYTCHYERTL